MDLKSLFSSAVSTIPMWLLGCHGEPSHSIQGVHSHFGKATLQGDPMCSSYGGDEVVTDFPNQGELHPQRRKQEALKFSLTSIHHP